MCAFEGNYELQLHYVRGHMSPSHQFGICEVSMF